jgi:hypothetical protein
MSSSIPVPSKGALRALRHIALGTSCTIAFGAGLITEDRRRRIHTAREASENARRLKTSRKYHSAGLAVANTFEEQVQNYCKYGPWKGDKQGILERDWNNAQPSSASDAKKSENEAMASLDISGSAPNKIRHIGRTDTTKVPNWQLGNPVGRLKNSVTEYSLCDSINTHNIGIVKDSEIRNPLGAQKAGEKEDSDLSSLPGALDMDKASPITYSPNMKDSIRIQTQLATQILIFLQELDTSGTTRIMEAVSAFHRTFQGGTAVQAINQDLLDACILLAQKCDSNDMLDVFIPVLSKILSCGQPIDEESLYKLNAGRAIDRLLDQSGYMHADHQGVVNVHKLKHAVTIFIAKTREKPKPLPMELREVGLRLCTATLRAHLYELTEAVYWRLLCARTDVTASEVECLILAEYRRAFWGQVLHHFSKYFSGTVPNQNQFCVVVDAAIDSALELRSTSTAEEILSTASKMARDGNLRTSTKWPLRILGQHWRTARDLHSTQALFDRLEHSTKQTSHSQAMYSAMIQFCIEAGCESEAQQYLERLQQLGTGDTMDVRTYGHLALAKAMKNDWAGVEADFRFMRKFAKGSTREHSDVFVPILKLFIASHDIGQVEDFVRLYLEKLDVAPNQYILNIIVDAYCKAGELSNIPRWINYVQQRGIRVDAVTFNTILSRCRKQWAAKPDDLFQLYKETKKRTGPIFDSTTVQILRRAATSSATPCRAAKLIRQARLPANVQCEKLEADMRRALERGDNAKVLKSYKFAMESRKPISQEGFSIAVRASIRSAADDNLTSTVKLIIDARSHGFDVLPSIARLLLHQVNTSKCNGEELVALVNHTLVEFKKRGLAVTLSIASKVISELVDRGRPEEALGFWKTLANYDHVARQPIDLILLTVLLRAHIMLSDLTGIKWVMTVLVENNILPDKQFRLVVKRARQEARRFLNAQPGSFSAMQHFEVLDECMRLVVAQRLHSETKRKEAEQLTLSIFETALVAKPDIAHAESKRRPSEISPVKRSQRLRNSSKIWERLGNYDKCNIHLANSVESRQEDGKYEPEIASHKVREGGRETIHEHECTSREHLRKSCAVDDGWVAASPESKETLSGWTELDVKNFRGYRETPPQIVEVTSS